MKFVEYNRNNAVDYAIRWANQRNPDYYDFSAIGGDCTSFASQCLYAGANVFNLTPTYGWYYLSASNRTPSWSGVEYFYNFLVSNHGIIHNQNYLNFTNAVGQGYGPFAVETDMNGAMNGDFIQLMANDDFYHTLVIVGRQDGVPLVATHSTDSLFRRLDSYYFQSARFIHVIGVRDK